MSKPKVLNKRADQIPKDAIYIGRGSKWGNPFSHLKNSQAKIIVATREESILCYKQWICRDYYWPFIPNPPTIKEIIDELCGRDLVCYCAPKPCHGDFLLEVANNNICGKCHKQITDYKLDLHECPYETDVSDNVDFRCNCCYECKHEICELEI
jgi:hypothetical protein